jgi:hypothetical protein
MADINKKANFRTVLPIAVFAVTLGLMLYFSGQLDDLIQAVWYSGKPADEVAFIETIRDTRDRWQNAPNDIRRDQIAAQRDQALCVSRIGAYDWRGYVESIGTYLFSKEVYLSVVLCSRHPAAL